MHYRKVKILNIVAMISNEGEYAQKLGKPPKKMRGTTTKLNPRSFYFAISYLFSKVLSVGIKEFYM